MKNLNRQRPNPVGSLAGRNTGKPGTSQQGRMSQFDTRKRGRVVPRTINPFQAAAPPKVKGTNKSGSNQVEAALKKAEREVRGFRDDFEADYGAETGEGTATKKNGAKKQRKDTGKSGLDKQLAPEMHEYARNLYQEGMIAFVLENINVLPLGIIIRHASIGGLASIETIFAEKGLQLPAVMAAESFREINNRRLIKPKNILNKFALVPAETFAREHKVDVKFLIAELGKWKNVVYYGKCGKREVPFINKSVIKWLHIIINEKGQKEILIEKRPISYKEPTARARAGAR